MSNSGIARIHDAVVSIRTRVPEGAMSADLLGTERLGHGVRIRPDGLIATIGYLINEADQVWISSRNGRTVPAFVVGYDFDSGLGLVKPALPLDGPTIEIGSATSLAVGDEVTVLEGGQGGNGLSTHVVARHSFAGRWEYLLEEAIFTAPAHESWSGAALLDPEGRLCGLGSLVIQGFDLGDAIKTVNMFVPIDLLTPVIDEICESGRRRSPPRPWLGVLIHDSDDQLQVVGVYRNCPADRAGVKPGDLIVDVGGAHVEDLAALFRSVWDLGSAGVEVPLTVLRDTKTLEVVIRSADRAIFQHKGTLQ